MVVDITFSCLHSKQTGSYSSLNIGCKNSDDDVQNKAGMKFVDCIDTWCNVPFLG
jgi:hypothetical protein